MYTFLKLRRINTGQISHAIVAITEFAIGWEGAERGGGELMHAAHTSDGHTVVECRGDRLGQRETATNTARRQLSPSRALDDRFIVWGGRHRDTPCAHTHTCTGTQTHFHYSTHSVQTTSVRAHSGDEHAI